MSTAKHILVSLLMFAVVSCSSTKETEKETSRSGSEEMRKYEESFRPSDHDMDPAIFLSELKRKKERESIPSEPAVVEPPIVVPGFRVQLFATASIDEANAKKAEAESAFPEQWFYLTFDPPTYKLRAGNFVNRAEAEQYAKMMSEQGFPDAWIVPDRVVKNIKPRHIPPAPEPQQNR